VHSIQKKKEKKMHEAKRADKAGSHFIPLNIVQEMFSRLRPSSQGLLGATACRSAVLPLSMTGAYNQIRLIAQNAGGSGGKPLYGFPGLRSLSLPTRLPLISAAFHLAWTFASIHYDLYFAFFLWA